MPAPITDPLHYAPVSRPYRRHVAWVIAILLHAITIGIVAGWRLAPDVTPPLPASLDVVLTRVPGVKPQAAQAIAEADQQAAGIASSGRDDSASHAAPPETPSPSVPATAPSSEPTPAPAAPATAPESDAPAAPSPEPESPPEPVATPDSQPASKPPAPAKSASPSPPPRTATAPSGQALLAQATASVSQRGFDATAAGDEGGDRQQQAARRAAKARYIDAWSRRVEDYGNRYYPAPEALDGQLRIRVVIGHDGQLRLAEVIQSSGHPELDRAALETVRGAAPYRPFDRGLEGRDSLAITRVWRFGKGNNFGVR